MKYRVLEPHLIRLANQYPVVTITGPRQSGKTTLCRKVFPKHAYINLEDLETRYQAQQDPKGFLKQYSDGVILDEIQRVPSLTSYIQVLVDEETHPGKFILTGSQQFEISNTVNQSLAGRTALLKLLPFSYQELYGSTKVPIDVMLYAGFYPRIHDRHLNPSEALSFYLATYVERDIRALANIKDLAAFERFLKLCAANIGQLINFSNLGNDCGVDQKTVQHWLTLLEASYIVFQLQPHYQNFRKRLTKSSKLYFYDTGLAAYLLGVSSAKQLQHHPARGNLFENFVILEFLKNRFNTIKDKNLYFFRDQTGNEIDLILDYGNHYIPIEIKSSQTINQSFFKGLTFYEELAGAQEKYLIYGGDNNKPWNKVSVFPYYQLDQLFEFLPG